MVLEEEKGRQDQIVSDADTEELLSDAHSDDTLRDSIFGYPTRPLYRELGNMLNLWRQTKHCPVLDLPKYELLDEKSYMETRASTVATIKPLLEGMESLWDLWNEEEKKYKVREIMLILGRRGLLDLIGLRKTVGTVETWPPPKKVLFETFQAKHSSKADLSVGARALAKHCHRDESTSWWGQCTGTENAKNKHAMGLLDKIFDNAAWINIHQIVHDVQLIEVRQGDGYGARWTLDGQSFRGFLEPQMEGGHDVGWKH